MLCYKKSMNVSDIFSRLVFEPTIVLSDLFFSLSLVLALYRKKKRMNVLWFFLHVALIFALIVMITIFFAFAARNLYFYSFYIKYFLVAALYLIPVRFLDEKSPMVSKISMAFGVYAMFFVLMEIGGSIPILVRDNAYSRQIDEITRNVINASIVLFGLFMHRFSLNRIKEIPAAGFVFFVILSVSEVILAFYSSRCLHSDEFNVAMFRFLAFFVISVMNYLAYFMIYEICHKNEQYARIQKKNYELEKNQELIAVSDENLQKLRAIRHDMKNQYACMKYFLDHKQYDELEKYLENYQDGVIQPLSYISSENEVLASVLNMEHSKARSKKVEFDVKLAVPKVLYIESIDLVSILSNLLDNAMDACIYYKMDNPIVVIRIREYQGYLYLEISNPIGENVTMEDLRKIKTTKVDKEFHGFGSKIVSSIVRKYEGVQDKSVENGRYVVKIMLKEEEKNESGSM